MLTVFAIDPGSERSAWLLYVAYDSGTVRPEAFGIVPNAELLSSLRKQPITPATGLDRLLPPTVVVIEKIESYGMAVGREVFDTVHWAGRFTEAAHPLEVVQLPRRDVKLAICGDSRAKDANIRQALLDRFGGKAAAVGTKAAPGPLHGISRDVWSALAIAVTYAERTPAT